MTIAQIKSDINAILSNVFLKSRGEITESLRKLSKDITTDNQLCEEFVILYELEKLLIKSKSSVKKDKALSGLYDLIDYLK